MVVNAVVREEPLVLGGQNRVTNDRRYVLISRDVSIFSGERDERLAVGVVDVTDGWKLEPDERTQVGHVLAIEIDLVPRTESEQRDTQQGNAYEHHAGQQPDDDASTERSNEEARPLVTLQRRLDT